MWRGCPRQNLRTRRRCDTARGARTDAIHPVAQHVSAREPKAAARRNPGPQARVACSEHHMVPDGIGEERPGGGLMRRQDYRREFEHGRSCAQSAAQKTRGLPHRAGGQRSGEHRAQRPAPPGHMRGAPFNWREASRLLPHQTAHLRCRTCGPAGTDTNESAMRMTWSATRSASASSGSSTAPTCSLHCRRGAVCDNRRRASRFPM